MRYNIIKTENYLLLVDDSEIKEGDYRMNIQRGYVKLVDDAPEYYNQRNDVFKKVIAHLPLNNSPILEGVYLLPPLEQEDDVEKLAENEYREYPNNPKDKPDWHYNKDIHCHKKRKAFIKGYNKSREIYKYTEEDLRKAIEMARKYPSDVAGFELNEIIQSLSQPKYPIAFEQGNIVDGKNYISVTRRHDNFTLWIGKYIY